MKMPLSIHARQILIAFVAGLVALGVSWQANKSVLDTVVTNSVNDKMDAQLAGIEQAVDARGRLDRSRILFLPELRVPDGNWGWDVRTGAGHWRAGQAPARTAYANGTLQPGHGAYSGRGWTAAGTRVHLRQRRSGPFDRPVIVTVVAPDSLIKAPIRQALIPTTSALGLLALILALTALLQVHFGLKPVRLLRAAIVRIRDGSLDRLAENQPKELKPLVAEINALISQNVAGLHHARQHLANLSHGLKTPLATLSLMMADDVNGSEEARALLASIDRRVAHHLQRARSAAVGGSILVKSDAWQITTDLLEILHNLNRDKNIGYENILPMPCDLAMDPEDLSEVMGNILENAFRHARATVRVSLQNSSGRNVRIVIEDDGPGIPDLFFSEALLPGRRLDESGKGYGFGLMITQEIVELYSGFLSLATSNNLGGLAAVLDLPPAGSKIL